MEKESKEFKNIRYRLIKLSPEQRCKFSLLYAVRALPFLSEKRNFYYWEEEKKQKLLFSIFRCIDISADVYRLIYIDKIFANYNDTNNANIVYARAARAAGNAANAAALAGGSAANAAARAAANAAAYAAANAAYATYAAANADYAAKAVAKSFAKFATNAATNAAVNVTTNSAADAVAFLVEANFINKWRHDNQLHKIFYSDIVTIENGTDEFDNDINIYGETWQYFLDDLEAIGCGYWGNLYKELFKNKFKFDEEELRLRLSVPDGVKDRGAKAVAEHIIAMKKQGAADVQRARLILIGSAAAGKTTLARKLENKNAKLTGYDSTHGVNRDIELNINSVITQIWDFGGQVIYHASHRCFMSERCVYVLVVNARNNDDYRDIGKIKYWIDTVNDYAKQEAKIFIVINEEDNRKYNFDDVRDSLKDEYGDLIHDIYSFNIGKDKVSLRNFKSILSEYIEFKGRQKIGANDKKALDNIRSEFENGKKLLEKETVDKILAKHGIDINDKKRALALFNTLGYALQYENFNDFVIDPYWISHGIYKVIDYMQNPQFKQPLYACKFKNIFANEKDYPENKVNHIFELMVSNKIGFRNSGIEGLFVPCVAAFFKPSGTTKPDYDNYMVKFSRDGTKEFPGGFFNQFMVDNADDLNKREVLEFWQTGMVLINNETNALVEMLENREIVITVWGKQKEQYADNLIGRFDKLIKYFGYVAIGTEEKDILTGKKIKVFKIISDVLIPSIIFAEKITPYIINGIEQLKNIFNLIP
jgi:hypothetical protein